MLRKCGVCGEYKELREFYYNSTEGSFGHCLECMKVLRKNWYDSRKEIKRTLSRPDIKEKECKKCGQVKVIEHFNYNANNNRYETYCKKCKSEYSRKYYQERYKEIKKKRYKRNGNRNKVSIDNPNKIIKGNMQ